MAVKRDEQGRFLPGTDPGPGRPSPFVEIDRLKEVGDIVDGRAWRAILTKAVAQAVEGDPAARDFVARLLVGDHCLADLDDLILLAAVPLPEAKRCNGVRDG